MKKFYILLIALLALNVVSAQNQVLDCRIYCDCPYSVHDSNVLRQITSHGGQYDANWDQCTNPKRLKNLHIYGGMTGSLDASNCIALISIYCMGEPFSNNQLTTLNVSGCSSIRELACQCNLLTSINVSGCSSLVYLGCYSNQLTSLNLSGRIHLNDLLCQNNLLTSLNISGCDSLSEIWCSNNKLNNSFLTSLYGMNLGCYGYGCDLFLYCNPSITEDGINLLQSNLPCSQQVNIESGNAGCSGLITIQNEVENNSFFPFPKTLWSGYIDQTAPPIKICADASNATKIIFENTGGNTDNLKFQIQSDPGSSHRNFSGYFESTNVTDNTITARLKHPEYLPYGYTLFRKDTIHIIDKTNPGVSIFKIPIEVYRAPVTFVHGVWSGPTAFSKMIDNSDFQNHWPKELMDLGKICTNYSNSSSFHFSENYKTVVTSFDATIKNAINHNFSAGKTDVVCHSMGGILTRQWIQADNFNDNINRLITLNTPHSGSQAANLLMVNSDLAALFDKHGKNTKNGAVDDLRVNSFEIDTLNNPPPQHSVASNVIVTHQDPDNVSWYTEPTARWLIYQIKTFYPTHTHPFTDLFNEPIHDLIVADSSQTGGIVKPTVIPFDNIWHSASTDKSNIIDRVYNLLCQDPDDISSFTKVPFQPPKLTYTFEGGGPEENLLATRSSQDSVKIINPSSGTTVIPGSVIDVKTISTSGITDISFEAGGADMDFYFDTATSSNATFHYPVPQNASYSIPLSVVGFNQNGFVNMDTITLFVNIIDTIKSLIAVNDLIYVQKGENASFSVYGYFADSIMRDLSSNPAVSYSMNNNDVATFIHPGVIKGLQVDTTSALILFRGVSTPVQINVIEPVIFNLGIEEPNPELSSENECLVLKQNFPNPFTNNTTIDYEVKQPTSILLSVYNMLGQKIATLVHSHQSAGRYTITWNGRDSEGVEMPNGVYYYTLQGQYCSESKKMILIR